MSYKREDGVPHLRPLPQHPSWQITPASTEPPTPPTPPTDPQDSFHASPSPSNLSKPFPSSRSRSVLNLTASTLFGIYSSPSNADHGSSREDISQGNNTPWGTGAMTPQTPASPSIGHGGASENERSPMASATRDHSQRLRRSLTSHYHKKTSLFSHALRSILLFGLGLGYGVVATHLHEDTQITPVKMEGLDRHSTRYMLFWGVAGVVLGNLLPYIDAFWEETTEVRSSAEASARSKLGKINGKANTSKKAVDRGPSSSSFTRQEELHADSMEESEDSSRRNFGADWNPVVRGIGAFIGIAFAIRKLPWESTLQASLTLTLANPVLWYLVDRSATGFALSTIVGILGAAIILGVNPSYVPSPTTHIPDLINAVTSSSSAAAAAAATGAGLVGSSAAGSGEGGAAVMNATYGVLGGLLEDYVSYEGISVSTWVASVLFCSCVCFGNIGRRLAED